MVAFWVTRVVLEDTNTMTSFRTYSQFPWSQKDQWIV